MKGVVLLCLLLSLGALVHAQDESEAKDHVLAVRLGNCVGNMTFLQCVDVAGQWYNNSGPVDIPYMEAGAFAIILPPGGAATVGNCTWEYDSPTSGKQVAFFTWNFAVFGNQDFGAGTNDSPDDEDTELSMPLALGDLTVICGVFAYGVAGAEQCESLTTPPADGCVGYQNSHRATQ